MKQRVITAAVALVLFIPIIWIGGIAVELTAAILAVVGVYELFRMKGLTLLSFEGVLSAVGAVLLVLPKERWFFFSSRECKYIYVILSYSYDSFRNISYF